MSLKRGANDAGLMSNDDQKRARNEPVKETDWEREDRIAYEANPYQAALGYQMAREPDVYATDYLIARS